LGACCWKGAKQIATEPATATAETATESTVAARLRPLRRSAKIEKLRGCRSDDSNQQRDRHSQRDQQAALGENAQKDFGFAMRSFA